LHTTSLKLEFPLSFLKLDLQISIFFTCHYILRFLIFPINAVLFSIFLCFDVFIVTIWDCRTL